MLILEEARPRARLHGPLLFAPAIELINQSLFYLSWIQDHQGDFEIAVQRSLGKVEKDVASDFKKALSKR